LTAPVFAKTFKNFDKFGLEAFADKLTDYLQIESRHIRGSFVLSLNSEFGSGKTTFFEMWSAKIASTENSPEVVYVNAWESDFQGDPLLAIMSAWLDRVEPKKADKNIESIKETMGKLCRFGLSIGNDVVRKVTGIDPIKAGQYAESKESSAKSETGNACFQLFRERQNLFRQLKSLLYDLARESENGTFVFIEELDRCRPDYAIAFLETIKHFFDIDGLVFVLGVDKKQLTASARSLLGQQLDFAEYYRKFAHRNVALPVKQPAMTERFARALVREYFSEEAFTKKGRFPYIQRDDSRAENIVTLCTAFSLNARQMHELFRTAAHALSAAEKKTSYLLWGWHVAALFVIALSLKDEDLYHRLGRNEVALQEFTARVNGLSLCSGSTRHAFWWAAVLYLAGFDKEPVENLEREFTTLGVWDASGKDDGAFQSELSRFGEAYRRWGSDSGTIFCDIYEVVEGVRTFADE